MSVVAQILRSRHPSAGERLASLAGYAPDTTYPEELEGGYYRFSEADDLGVFLRSEKVRRARLQGAQITMLQMSSTSVWIKYPRGSVFYRDRVRDAILIKNNRKRKKLFFISLGKLMLKAIGRPR